MTLDQAVGSSDTTPKAQVTKGKKKKHINWMAKKLDFPDGLRLCASTAGATGSIPGQGTKILAWCSPKTKTFVH